MKTTFYTYVHCNEKGVPFYVGKGSTHRANDTRYRGKIWKDYVKKYPFNFSKTRIYHCDSEEQAFELERELIWLLRKSMGLWLANVTDGGEGMSGYNEPKSPEHRKKIGLAQKGKSRNPVSIAKMRETRAQQCKALTKEEKQKRNEVIKASVKKYWKAIPKQADKQRAQKISKALKSRSPEQKALDTAKGWETRRRNQQKET